jgi:hypothetical protein
MVIHLTCMLVTIFKSNDSKRKTTEEKTNLLTDKRDKGRQCCTFVLTLFALSPLYHQCSSCEINCSMGD